MASQELVGQLLAEAGKLGYDIKQAAKADPVLYPFDSSDSQQLWEQVESLGNAAFHVGDKSPTTLSHKEVYAALVQVRRAQGHYDTIYRTNDPRPTKDEVNSTVDQAISMMLDL